MAIATFTTWSDLHTAMLNALANWVINRSGVTSFTLNNGGTSRQFEYRTFDELKQGLEYVKTMAELETGSVSLRTYAVPGPR